MKKINKYSIILLSIISIIFISIAFTYGNKSNDSKDKLNLTYDGIYIHNKWMNNISILKNESAFIQIPVYDFNNEIDLETTQITVNNFNIGEIEYIRLENQEQYDNFTSYMLHFYMKFDKPGNYQINDIELEIHTDENTYFENIGDYNITVYDTADDNKNDLEIIGGSGFIDILNPMSSDNNVNCYPATYTLKNNTNTPIQIDNININKSSYIYIDNLNKVTINPNEEKVIEFNIKLTDSIYSTMIQPTVTYTINNNNKFIIGSQILVADSISLERLSELIKNQQ